jgi:hypothetical protein
MYILFNKILVNFKNIILTKHKQLLNNNLTLKEILTERGINCLYTNFYIISFSKIIKNIYQNIYYPIYNIFYKISNNDIVSNIMVESILINQDYRMNELRTKTNKAINNNADLYSGVKKWIEGDCWLNMLITNGYADKLSNIDKFILNSINKSIELVEPMSRPLLLFHGFEYLSNYNEDDLIVGKIFEFPGILSKTSCFRIAECFAKTYNYYQPKYFVISYPKGSKHIGLGIKPHRYDEYEYIGKSNEKFRIEKIYKRLNYLTLETFYICTNLDY